MKFLVDRCAGAVLAAWLGKQGHDVVYSPTLGPDPGDAMLLQMAHEQARTLVTIDTDFGALVYAKNQLHSGIVRLPDVSSLRRIELFSILLRDHCDALEEKAIITIKGERIRISKKPDS